MHKGLNLLVLLVFMTKNLQTMGDGKEGHGHHLDEKRPLEIFIEGLEITDTAQMSNAIGAGPHGQGTNINQLVSGGNAHLDNKLAQQIHHDGKVLGHTLMRAAITIVWNDGTAGQRNNGAEALRVHHRVIEVGGSDNLQAVYRWSIFWDRGEAVFEDLRHLRGGEGFCHLTQREIIVHDGGQEVFGGT